MAQDAVLSQRRIRAFTPLKADAWEASLKECGLFERHVNTVHSIFHGFNIGFPSIQSTYAPTNNSSIDNNHTAFNEILERELDSQRYIAPMSQKEVEHLIGPFQSSPLSLVPKANKPGKFRLIQNFSFPHSEKSNCPSMNSWVDSSDYPCFWGTFRAVSYMLLQLPPASQVAVRDIAEAYRIIPLHPSQWTGTVVRTSNDNAFCIDTCASFGGAANCGVFGQCANAACDILRAKGIGPIAKWVDDHIFVRIPSSFLPAYNERRQQWRAEIRGAGGLQQSGGQKWFEGRPTADGSREEFVEDMEFPLKALIDSEYPYTLTEVNQITTGLGIPWEQLKDRDFSDTFIFTGFLWDLKNRTVTIPDEKRDKYLQAIADWSGRPTHDLGETQKLYGKLLHVSALITEGQAYLTTLERMISLFRNRPFKLYHAPKGTDVDLKWWSHTLSSPSIVCPIPDPCDATTLSAFSDASSGVGIGITINGLWRAWKLLPGWNRDGRDIGWAEAVGFELLVRAIATSNQPLTHIRVHGDNQGIVKGWRNGQSQNPHVNSVFKRIHHFLNRQHLHVYLQYIRSANNPADHPSRGRYPSCRLLLPSVNLPAELQPFLCDPHLNSGPF
jgi:hypothetical protein